MSRRLPKVSLFEELANGASYVLLRGTIANMTKEEVEERDNYGVTPLCRALYAKKPLDVIELLLDASSEEGLRTAGGYMGGDALCVALTAGEKATVMLVTDKILGEDAWKPASEHSGDGEVADYAKYLDALLGGPLISDREMVDRVVGMAPEGQLVGCGYKDVLRAALSSPHDSNYILDMCLERGLALEERMRREPLMYVTVAARMKDLAMVQRMHEMIPQPEDDSDVLASPKEYAAAMKAAARNSTHRLEIMEYLEEEGGCEWVEFADTSFLELLREPEDFDWLLSRAPHLLQQWAWQKNGKKVTSPLLVYVFSRHYPDETLEYLLELMVRMLEPKVIADCLLTYGRVEKKAWRRRVRRLFELPPVYPRQHWRGLMEAIRNKQYEDVEVMVAVASQEDLAIRNKDGTRAMDVARKDSNFPPELLSRMAVATKSAVA